ncbi:MBL fold metallo-hydrolase [Acetobacteraceae bacterium KSS8]|uniref:MBL fold metallo-hydrolase n=1 Tax=Endosaccharibacter trunci TaxID=2812733 RepID=A0ABT1W385_9PROT|nr:MBL fold metallo-hydrolase [Acetobacteraceae bacterium KSS8]
MSVSAAGPVVAMFHDEPTGSAQYVVADPGSGACAIIDPVLELDRRSGTIATRSADAILAHVERQGLRVRWIVDTHPHADHLSAAAYLSGRTGAPVATGTEVTGVQRLWKGIYGLPESFPTDGSQWDRLLRPGDTLELGGIEGRILFSPGHTLCSITPVFGDAAFIHDTLFMPDSGSARADFPGGDAAALWRSIGEIMRLPDECRLFVGHDYRPQGRAVRSDSTVAAMRAEHPHLRLEETAFVRMRRERDATLPLPELMLLALQVNIRAGRLPESDAEGRRNLLLPIGAFSGGT